LADSKTTAIIT